jgi:hypothetical protein
MKLVHEAHRQRLAEQQKPQTPPVASPAPVPSEEPTHDDSDSTQRSE